MAPPLLGPLDLSLGSPTQRKQPSTLSQAFGGLGSGLSQYSHWPGTAHFRKEGNSWWGAAEVGLGSEYQPPHLSFIFAWPAPSWSQLKEHFLRPPNVQLLLPPCPDPPSHPPPRFGATVKPGAFRSQTALVEPSSALRATGSPLHRSHLQGWGKMRQVKARRAF